MSRHRGLYRSYKNPPVLETQMHSLSIFFTQFPLFSIFSYSVTVISDNWIFKQTANLTYLQAFSVQIIMLLRGKSTCNKPIPSFWRIHMYFLKILMLFLNNKYDASKNSYAASEKIHRKLMINQHLASDKFTFIFWPINIPFLSGPNNMQFLMNLNAASGKSLWSLRQIYMQLF